MPTAKSLANLKPFKPGPDPRRWTRGRVGGWGYAEWVDELTCEDEHGQAKYPHEALTIIRDDKRAPVWKRVAAGDLLGAMKKGFARNGLPLGNASRERLLDRLHGKPKTSLEVTRKQAPPDLLAMQEMLAQLVSAHPQAAALAAQRVANECQPALPVITTTAEDRDEVRAAALTNVEAPREAPPEPPKTAPAGGRASPPSLPENRTPRPPEFEIPPENHGLET